MVSRERHGNAGTGLTLDIHRDLLQGTGGNVSIVNVINAEWALELHTDELLHARVSAPNVLNTIRAKWVR